MQGFGQRGAQQAYRELKKVYRLLGAEGNIRIVTKKSPEAINLLRHSAAHLCAAAVLELFPEDEHLARWIRMAQKEVEFQGLPARICWLGYGERARAGGAHVVHHEAVLEVRRRPAVQVDGAALGAGAIVMDVIASNDKRLPHEQIERIRQLRRRLGPPPPQLAFSISG